MKRLLLALPTGLMSVTVTALIVYLSLASDPFDVRELPVFPGFDKLCHVIMYFACAGAYILDYAKHKLPHHTRLSVELALSATAALVGLLMEVAQLTLTSDRSYDILDWAADLAGVAAAFLLLHFVLLHFFRKSFYHASVHRRHHHRRS
ncbi:hypothetical protein [Sodaliphilus pleomorphus]|jgi:hypothetical protein|uniref:hypothetical protein n=1 Tax=Sodaliphilus pleomorphus TaxID=2606626 RepID=UPI002409B079|nr:hypothetical protein [Sodaliphilus pleomorphus]MDD6687393.1 hypothetical protein [Sodaliphilus pleomorphus]